MLSEKLEPVEYQPGEVIILKDDEGTCMYILYYGTVGLYSDRACTMKFME